MIEIEKIILKNLQYNEQFARKTLPFIKDEYFLQPDDRIYFQQIQSHFVKYNSLPTKETVIVDIQEAKEKQEIISTAIEMAEDFSKEKDVLPNSEWLLNQTEEFCKGKALYLALMEAISIVDNDKNNIKNAISKTAIPDILSKALSVSFDSDVGHNYLNDSDKRFEYYTLKPAKVPFHLDSFNFITHGGAERKTLNAVVGGTNTGKTIFLCDLAANYMKAGFNVLYITLEMADMKIAQRIDANLMDVDINEIEKMPKLLWEEKIKKVKEKCKGKLVFKEYPTSGANASHFRFLIRELQQKQNFIPDVIIVDYINITASVRYKNASDTYSYMKGVTEELRGLMIETNVVGWTGVQFNRSGLSNSDPDMTNTGESMGIVHTLDFLIALVATEELVKNGQLMIKQLKSRYGDKDKNTTFMVGIDRPKMRFFELSKNNLQYTPKQTPVPQQVVAPLPTNNNTQQTATPITKSKPKGVKI